MHQASIATGVVLVVTAAATAWSQSSSRLPVDPAAVVAAERAFARASIEQGMQAAFLAHLAEDAVVFRPGPVPARAWFRRQAPVKGRLEWAPDFAAIASSGDVAFTAGPWKWQDPDGSSRFGHYLTVWRRDPQGAWKVVIDAGASHATVDLEVEVEVPPWSAAREREEERLHGHTPIAVGPKRLLLEIDRKVAADIERHGWPAAFTRWAADDVRLYRAGVLPLLGKDAVVAGLADRAGVGGVRCAALNGAASAGDLAYTYGTAQHAVRGAQTDSIAAHAYLRVWRMTHDGRHVIAAEVESPMPSPPR
jgi:ketosteroid isomerase-like protein